MSHLKEGPLLRCEASACRVLFSRSTQYCKTGAPSRTPVPAGRPDAHLILPPPQGVCGAIFRTLVLTARTDGRARTPAGASRAPPEILRATGRETRPRGHRRADRAIGGKRKRSCTARAWSGARARTVQRLGSRRGCGRLRSTRGCESTGAAHLPAPTSFPKQPDRPTASPVRACARSSCRRCQQ